MSLSLKIIGWVDHESLKGNQLERLGKGWRCLKGSYAKKGDGML